MKITETELKTIIDEELEAMLENGEIDENILTRLKARAKGGLQGLGGKALSAMGAKKAGAELQTVAARKKGAVVLADYSKKIDAMVSGMVKDLDKLGLDIKSDALKPVQQALSAVKSSNTRLKGLLPKLAGAGLSPEEEEEQSRALLQRVAEQEEVDQ